MKWLLLILALLAQMQPDDLWTELKQIVRQASDNFADQNWTYSITWQTGFEQANSRLLNYYSSNAVNPAIELSGRAPLVRDDATGLIKPESLRSLRSYLRNASLTGIMNIIVRCDEARILIICQTIHQKAENDSLFSGSANITPDLALVLRQREIRNTAQTGNLIQKIYIDDPVLAVKTAELVDGNENEEIAVLTHKTLLVFVLEDDRFVLHETIGLHTLRSSYYPNRRPGGRLYAIKQSEGEDTLLINANIYRNGALYSPGEVPAFREADAQPLPALLSDPESENRQYLKCQYIPGEDNRSLLAPMASGSIAGPGALMFRDYIQINNQVNAALALSRNRQMFMLDLNENQIQQISQSRVSIKRIFAAERQGGELHAWVITKNHEQAGENRIAELLLQGRGEVLYEMSSDLDIIDATLYNSGGSETKIILVGQTSQKAYVLQFHTVSLGGD